MFDSASTDASTFDALLVKALNQLDFAAAQLAVLGLVRDQVKDKRSWDSPQYTTSRRVQSRITQRAERDDRLTFFALDTLRDRYFLRDVDRVICETPQDFWSRVATGVAVGGLTVAEAESPKHFADVLAHAQALYDSLSQLHALFATPILTNAGTSRGKLISCFLGDMDDSILDIFGTCQENAVLAQGGGGIGTYVGHLRGQGAPLSRGGTASGPLPFLKVMDSSTHAVHQAGARRGAAAAYLDVSHPDIEDFIDMRRPEGAEERRCQNLNHGVVVTDAFMQAVEQRAQWNLVDPKTKKVAKTVDAYGLWKRLILTRVLMGEPYLLFINSVNRNQPAVYRKRNMLVKTSNLCSEITLPTSPGPKGRTAICCLGSLNYGRYLEWQHDKDRLTYNMVKGLDNVLDVFIREAGVGYEKAVRSAVNGRDIGLGAMGWFDYLQQRGIPFESVEARSHNKMRFREFGQLSDKASRQLAVERGPAPDALRVASWPARVLVPLLMLVGANKYGVGQRLMSWLLGPECLWRNVNRQAVAPTATIGIIAGASPSIEPPAGNVFSQKTLSGSFIVRNPALAALLQTKYPEKATYTTWASITENGGSVQHLDWLTDDERKVFRTAYELNQRELVQQAADRQPYISQAQSLNLFFTPGSSGKLSASYLHDVHLMAWKLGVKSLYYVRSESVLKAASLDAKDRAEAGDGDVGHLSQGVARILDRNIGETCTVCQ